MQEKFPAKLLLFGEYTVLNGSQALSVPLHRWTGKWEQQSDNPKMSLIPEYFRWLSKVDIVTDDQFNRLVSEYEEGWMYQADVPIGYGVGSSGAFVAAMYDRYICNQENDYVKSCEMMARMESYFHGSSSGMDPLVSWSGKSVHKDESGEFQLIDDPGWPEGYKIYLLDSGIVRETASLVNRYKERSDDHATSRKIKNRLMPEVNHAIKYYMDGDAAKLEKSTHHISQMQREYFDDVIPDQIKTQWDELSLNEGVYVKLCGAGGGGYFMVIDTTGSELEKLKGPEFFQV